MKWEHTPANYVTLLRVLLFPVLWWCALTQQSLFFAWGFLLAGFTDALDGFLARTLQQTSEFGAWFDSFADNLMNISLIFWFWLLLEELVRAQWILITIALLLFVVGILYGFVKFKKMTTYHLYSAKLANILIYTFVLHALFFSPNQYFFYVMIGVVILNQAEEIIMTAKNKKSMHDQKSIFLK